MKIYIDVPGGEPIDPDLLAQLIELGFKGIRRDIVDLTKAATICQEFVARDLHPVFLVGSGDKGKMSSAGRPLAVAEIGAAAGEVARLAEAVGLFDRDLPAAIEIGNEPDVAAPRWSPARFAEVLRAAHEEIRRISSRAILVSGGILTTRRSSLDYLSATLAAGVPPDCHLGYHTYRETGPDTPHEGFAVRQDEFAALRRVAGERPVWGTEIGWHTAPHPRYLRVFGIRIRIGSSRYSDDDVARFVLREIELNAAAGSRSCTIYQINDGPDRNSGLDNFGIRRLDGEWKPVARAIQSVSARYV